MSEWLGPSHKDVCNLPNPCSCCPDCGEHSYSAHGECLYCTRDEWLHTGQAAGAKKKKKSRSTEQYDELTPWARTKPRSERQRREAHEYCKQRGIQYPWDEPSNQ